MHLKLVLLLVPLVICCSVVSHSQDLNRLEKIREAISPTGEMLGAAPEDTQAEQLQKSENAFQTKLVTLTKLVNALEARIGELRRQAAPPADSDVQRINQDLAVYERDTSGLATLSISPLAQAQRTDLLDRLFEMNVGLEIMSRRWDASWSVFGMDFFQSAPPLTSPSQQPVPANYRIRAGDSLKIVTTSVLGAQSEYNLVVDSKGGIRLSGAGRMPAAGMTTSQLRQLLADKLSSRFGNLRVEVWIQELATLQVQVSGEIRRPGTYTLTGMPTVISALYQAGGPKRTAGSFRHISVFRDGARKCNVDLYEFLLSGDKSQDILLEDGDLIFVDPVGPTVSVGGEVIRPGRYEPDFPIMLGELLRMAGGVKPSGYLQNVSVERVVNNEYVVLLSGPLVEADGRSKFVLQAGDEISVLAVRQDKTNKVSIEGPLASPGMFGLREGMRVSGLVKLARGLAEDREVYGKRADILRIDPLEGTEIITFSLDKALSGDPEHDILLQKLDQVFLYVPDQIVFRPRLVTLSGAVARPAVYRRTQGMRVSDVIAAAGGVRPQAYLTRANLTRRDADDKTTLYRIDLQAALNGDPDANLVLSDRDKITIFTYDEVQWQDRSVRVEGAVQRPGVYVRSENMRVSDLVFISGGLLPEAARELEVARHAGNGENDVTAVDVANLLSGSEGDVLLADGDVVTVPAVNSYVRSPQIVYVKGEVTNPGPYPLRSRHETITSVIERAGGLTDLANVRGALFLRQRENFENIQQAQDVENVLRRAQLFADKQFMAHLGKIGMQMPTDFMKSTDSIRDDAGKPSEVIAEERLEGTGTVSVTRADGTAAPGEEVAPEIPQESASAMGPALGPSDTFSLFDGTDTLAPVTESVRISVDLAEALGDVDSPDNLTLRNGDRIVIPKKTNVVTVIGAVLHPHSLATGPGKNADYYIERSGGYAQDASRKHVIVVRANGEALPKNAVKSVEPGDVVVVPTTGFIDVTRKWEKTRNVTKVISDILSSVFILTRF